MIKTYRFDITQKSDEWRRLHIGRFSSAVAGQLLAKPDTKTYTNLIKRIALERHLGRALESSGPITHWIIRGEELEPEAREAYQTFTGNKVVEIGCIELGEWVMASPDGLIGKHGVLEIKCPKDTTHLFTAEKQKISSQYHAQIQFQLMVTGRPWADFFSYHPDHEPVLLRIPRCDDTISLIRARLETAINDVGSFKIPEFDIINESQPPKSTYVDELSEIRQILGHQIF